MALDEKRGIVYAPTGSANPDFDGSARHGDNLYANSLLALDAQTGKLLWHFQAVHHDLWDRDFPSPPVLLTVRRGGKRVDAVAQTSKQGFVFVFDRVTGKPLFPIEERAVPQSTVPGEQTAPTQPHPVLPAPIARQRLTEDMLTRRTPGAHAAVLARFKTLDSDGPFAPFRLDKKSVVFPGYDGGAEWGGPAIDPARGVMYVNSNDVPWLGGTQTFKGSPNFGLGVAADQEQCVICHGKDRKGTASGIPSLVNLGGRMSREAVDAVITGGKGRMPGFAHLSAEDRGRLLDILMNEYSALVLVIDATTLKEGRLLGGSTPTRYQFTGYEKFQDPDGYPAAEPPWGTLSAIDLNTGKTLWKIPFGEYPELIAKGLRNTGSENYGGPLLTKTGLLFIGATLYDRKFRAFDSRTGRLIWETQLPYAGAATPISYSVKGRQYVLIATSGGKDRKGPQGSAYIAYALPVAR